MKVLAKPLFVRVQEVLALLHATVLGPCDSAAALGPWAGQHVMAGGAGDAVPGEGAVGGQARQRLVR